MENTNHNFWLYFNKSDRTFSHSCNVRHPAEHASNYIEVGGDEDLEFGWVYTLDEDNVTVVKGDRIPASPRE